MAKIDKIEVRHGVFVGHWPPGRTVGEYAQVLAEAGHLDDSPRQPNNLIYHVNGRERVETFRPDRGMVVDIKWKRGVVTPCTVEAITKDKVLGMILGIAIGDALGMPVETWNEDRIKAAHPDGVRDYVSAEGHKWFDGRKPGTWTDDTQLTMAVCEAIMKNDCFDMDEVARNHVEAFKNPAGWGSTTKEAIQRIRDGVHWTNSASESSPQKVRGMGNGVPMKISPLGAFHAARRVGWKKACAECAMFAQMTHDTTMGVASGMCQAYAIGYCLSCTPELFSPDAFAETMIKMAKTAEVLKPLRFEEDNLAVRMKELKQYNDYDRSKIIQAFGGGSCYVYNSLPFSFMFFLKGPSDIETLFQVTNAGGDTDTNASMVGGLMGALNGASIFPENLVDKLDQKEVLCDMAERFSGTLGIQ